MLPSCCHFWLHAMHPAHQLLQVTCFPLTLAPPRLTICVCREGYRDAYLAAHFEVPGEMFSLAMEAKRSRGMGVVGSTQNILDFIAAK